VRGAISIAPELASFAPRGRLVVGWLTPDEQRGFATDHRPSLRTARALFTERLEVVGDADFLTLATRVSYEIGAPDQDIVPFALLDVCGNLFESVFGGCDGTVLGFGARVHAGPGEARGMDIELTRRSRAPVHAEGCTGERKELVHVDAARTAGTIGNDPHRRVCVYLPPT
jgi:hypothetical protein